MKMYAVRDVDGVLESSYHHTIEGAEAAIDGRWRRDADGDHPGREWLKIHVIERDSQPCKSCGGESQNEPQSYANYPYCRGCHYTGSAADDEHMNDLYAFRVAFPDAEYVGVEHTGGNCFWLCFRWADDPFYYVATDGEASLPDDEDGGWAAGWGYVGRHFYDETVTDHPDEYGTELLVANPAPFDGGKGVTKSQVITAIKKDRKARFAAPVFERDVADGFR